MGLFNKKELERIAELEKMVKDLKGELNEIHQGMNKEIGYKKHELNQLTEDIGYKRAILSSRESRLENLSKEIEEKAILLNSINNEIHIYCILELKQAHSQAIHQKYTRLECTLIYLQNKRP